MLFILSVGTATVLDKITIKKMKESFTLKKIIHEGGYIIPGFSLMENSLEFLTTKLETTKYQPMEFPSSTNESVFVWYLYRSSRNLFHNTRALHQSF